MSESAVVFNQAMRIRELQGRLNEAENSMALLARERDDATRRAVNAERDLDLALRSPRDPSVLARHYIASAKADGDGWRNLKAQAEAPVAADASLVVEAAAEPPTVSDLLRVLPVVEWHDADGWHQAKPRASDWPGVLLRTWTGEWSRWQVGGKSTEECPARFVPASEADADPSTRGLL